jgi:hypothetical protein
MSAKQSPARTSNAFALACGAGQGKDSDKHKGPGEAAASSRCGDRRSILPVNRPLDRISPPVAMWDDVGQVQTNCYEGLIRTKNEDLSFLLDRSLS